MLRHKTCHLGLNREPFKMWLAKLGSDKIDEAFDPSKGIDQMIDF